MLNYFLQEGEPLTSSKTKKIVKERLTKSKKYQPFHIDCQHSKRKICYCHINPICNLSDQQKIKLWKNYQGAAEFYAQVDHTDKQKAVQKYQKCIQKIRHLDKTQVLAFVNNIKTAKLSNFANQSYQNPSEGYYQ